MADFQTLARQKAKKYGLDPGVFERQIRQESGFNPNAVSPAGAIGIAQIMPATARGWGVNPRDPNAALDAAAKNMARYVQQYGSYKNALVAYNAGPGAVGRGSLPAETQNYIKTILGGGGEPSASTARAASASSGPSTTDLPGATFKATVPTVDQAGFEQARKNAIIGQLIARRNPQSILLRSGLLSTTEPSLSDFMGSKTLTNRVPGKTVTSQGAATAPSAPPSAGGTAVVNGKPVLSSFLPAIQYARAHGWKGTVTSGVRTKAQQMVAASNFGLQHYGPAGPLGSNHVEGHSGAIDVSDPDAFERALRGFKGRKPFRGMKDDPVHFSWTGH